MIHRIEPGYLRTNDALSRREERERRRRRRAPEPDADDTPVVDRPAILEEESETVTLDLVA